MKTFRPITHARTVAALALAAPLLLAASPPTSESYAFSTYRERSGPVSLLVDTRGASLHDSDRFIPLRVAVGLVGKAEPVRVTPESFTLIDPSGSAASPVSYQELSQTYTRRSFDESLFHDWPMTVDSLFSRDRRLPSHFFPAPGRATRTSAVEVAPFTWFEDVIYFPRPSAGLVGVMTLRLSGGGLVRPVEVRFRIPAGPNPRG